ncbi:aminotransferase class I/II-fold pyridoxal phosphate-dependent enzyme [Dactylosporangium sp. McL0621]|uniref:aminotransferase class I/II-fold pyridoxal phosphate-dependent enzyme n=1 Tax=Dactylosporangium sp. McL0621 TaxID=3415678 RepID=UPI003CF93F19
MTALNLADLAADARRRLDPAIWDFIEGGAGQERTLAGNRAAFERTWLRPTVLTAAGTPRLDTTILGRRWAVPFGVAPLAYQTLAHPEGELATVRAAGAAGVPVVVSTFAGRTFEELAEAATAPLWLQVYCFRDRNTTTALVRRAEAAGFDALVVTADTPHLGRRLRDERNGFRLPPHIRPANLPAGDYASPSGHARAELDPGLDWGIVDWLRGVTSLPVLVKGVLTGADAERALTAGVDGIIVSNHGGRQLDGAPPTLDALPEVAAATRGKCPLLLDGGVRHGADIIAARALGADAVLIGRPVLHGLAAGAQDGVARMLEILREETLDAMTLAGLSDLDTAGPDTVTTTAPPEPTVRHGDESHPSTVVEPVPTVPHGDESHPSTVVVPKAAVPHGDESQPGTVVVPKAAVPHGDESQPGTVVVPKAAVRHGDESRTVAVAGAAVRHGDESYTGTVVVPEVAVRHGDESQPGTVVGPAPAVLRRAELHPSLSDPLMDTMNFLNEIALRHPDAISFAPGRPHDKFFNTEDIVAHVRRYLVHLQEQGRSPEQIRSVMYQYGPTAGQIREIIAGSLQADEGIDVPPESIVVTVGAQEAMLLVVRALISGPRDVLLVSSPCYVGISGAARILDVDVVPVVERPAGLEPADVAAAIEAQLALGRRPRAFYVIPDHSNPAGTTVPLAARHALLELAARYDILIIEDSPYRLVSPGAQLPTLKALDSARRVVHLGSFSKTVFPGARVGFVVADQAVEGGGLLADELAKIKSMVTVNTSPLSQAAVAGALLSAGGRVTDLNAAPAEHYGESMRLVLEQLDRRLPAARREALGVSWNRPTGGFFLSVTVPFIADNAALARSAERFAVLWTPMSYFYPGGGGDRAIRLSTSYLTPEEIEEGIGRLARFIESEAA